MGQIDQARLQEGGLVRSTRLPHGRCPGAQVLHQVAWVEFSCTTYSPSEPVLESCVSKPQFPYL